MQNFSFDKNFFLQIFFDKDFFSMKFSSSTNNFFPRKIFVPQNFFLSTNFFCRQKNFYKFFLSTKKFFLATKKKFWTKFLFVDKNKISMTIFFRRQFFFRQKFVQEGPWNLPLTLILRGGGKYAPQFFKRLYLWNRMSD